MLKVNKKDTSKTKVNCSSTLVNPFYGGLFRGSFCGGGRGVKITPCLKLVRYISPHTYLVSENIPFSTKTSLIMLCQVFSAKNNSMRAVLEIF